MADVTIDDLPSGAALQDSDSLVVEQGSSGSRRTVKLTADAIKSYVPNINQKYIWDRLGYVPANLDGSNATGLWNININGFATKLFKNATYEVSGLTTDSLTVTDMVVKGEVDLTQATALRFPEDTIAVKDTIRAENKVICEGQIETDTFKADGAADAYRFVAGTYCEGTRWRARPTNQPAQSAYPEIYYDVDLNVWRGYVKTATGGYWQDLSLRRIKDDPNNEVNEPYNGMQVMNQYDRLWRYLGDEWKIVDYPGKTFV